MQRHLASSSISHLYHHTYSICSVVMRLSSELQKLFQASSKQSIGRDLWLHLNVCGSVGHHLHSSVLSPTCVIPLYGCHRLMVMISLSSFLAFTRQPRDWNFIFVAFDFYDDKVIDCVRDFWMDCSWLDLWLLMWISSRIFCIFTVFHQLLIDILFLYFDSLNMFSE